MKVNAFWKPESYSLTRDIMKGKCVTALLSIPSAAKCLVPLGLEDKRLHDGAMTASTYHNGYLTPWNGRINHRWSWAPRSSARNQWLQIYFGTLATVTGVAMQGRQDANQWVKTFKLTFSRDGFNFVNYPKVRLFVYLLSIIEW